MTDGEPETAVSASLQKIKSIKKHYKMFSSFILFYYFIKSKQVKLVGDSFVKHFDDHFAYLKTLDFSFKHGQEGFFAVFQPF